MIRWSAMAVSQGLDDLEGMVSEMEPILERSRERLEKVIKLPNLPQYMAQDLRWLDSMCEATTVSFRNRIEHTRGKIPEKELAKESGEYGKWLSFFDGDEGRAKQAVDVFAMK